MDVPISSPDLFYRIVLAAGQWRNSPRRKTPALTQTAYLYLGVLPRLRRWKFGLMLIHLTVPLDNIDMSRPELYEANVYDKWFARLRKEDPVHYCSESMCGRYLHQVSRGRITQIMRIPFAKVDPRAQRVRPEPASNRAGEHRAGFRLPI